MSVSITPPDRTAAGARRVFATVPGVLALTPQYLMDLPILVQHQVPLSAIANATATPAAAVSSTS